MTPKQFIKYVQYLDKNNFAICDGLTTALNPFEILKFVLVCGGFWGLYHLYVHFGLYFLTKLGYIKNENNN